MPVTLPDDPACPFCGETALTCAKFDADERCFWCATCGALGVFTYTAPDEHNPEHYNQDWTRPSHSEFRPSPAS
jgi:hypothetical protein